jgi:hypothetical protein
MLFVDQVVIKTFVLLVFHLVTVCASSRSGTSTNKAQVRYICIVVSLTTLDPISLGTKMYLNDVLGTLEMQWMLVSFIRKV